jgi:hypothetical protein
MGGACNTHGIDEKHTQNLNRKPERNTSFEAFTAVRILLGCDAV